MFDNTILNWLKGKNYTEEEFLKFTSPAKELPSEDIDAYYVFLSRRAEKAKESLTLAIQHLDAVSLTTPDLPQIKRELLGIKERLNHFENSLINHCEQLKKG